MYNRNRLIALFKERAVRFGEFTLASGKTSTYYVDKMQITLHSEGLRLVCEGLLDLLTGVDCQAVGGMTIGADPIVGGMLTIAAERGIPFEGFLVRKEPKGHGTNRYVEGPIQAGWDVVILEDVVTTGGSSLLAIERVEEFGCKIKQVITIVDRLQGGAEAFTKRGYDFVSLLTIRDFGIEPPSDG